MISASLWNWYLFICFLAICVSFSGMCLIMLSHFFWIILFFFIFRSMLYILYVSTLILICNVHFFSHLWLFSFWMVSFYEWKFSIPLCSSLALYFFRKFYFLFPFLKHLSLLQQYKDLSFFWIYCFAFYI